MICLGPFDWDFLDNDYISNEGQGFVFHSLMIWFEEERLKVQGIIKSAQVCYTTNAYKNYRLKNNKSLTPPISNKNWKGSR